MTAARTCRSTSIATPSSTGITLSVISRSWAAKAAAASYPDPADKEGKLYAVDVVPVRKLKQPVTLAAIKADKSFATFALTRVPRLSVMPVTDDQWERIVGMAT